MKLNSFLKSILLDDDTILNIPKVKTLSDETLIEILQDFLEFQVEQHVLTVSQYDLIMHYIPYTDRADIFEYILNQTGFLNEILHN